MYSTTVHNSVPCEGLAPGQVFVTGEDSRWLSVISVEVRESLKTASRSAASPDWRYHTPGAFDRHAVIDAVSAMIGTLRHPVLIGKRHEMGAPVVALTVRLGGEFQ